MLEVGEAEFLRRGLAIPNFDVNGDLKVLHRRMKQATNRFSVSHTGMTAAGGWAEILSGICGGPK